MIDYKLIRHQDDRLNVHSVVLFTFLDVHMGDYPHFTFNDRCNLKNTGVKDHTHGVFNYLQNSNDRSYVKVFGTEYDEKHIDIERKSFNGNIILFYDCVSFSFMIDGKKVEIWFVSIKEDSWSEPTIYIIPHYVSERKSDNWGFLKEKIETLS